MDYIQSFSCFVASSSIMLLLKLLVVSLISINLNESRITEISRNLEGPQIQIFMRNTSKLFLNSFELAVYVDFDVFHLDADQENVLKQDEMPLMILETQNIRKELTGLKVSHVILPSYVIIYLRNLEEVDRKMLLISEMPEFESRIPHIFISKSGVENPMNVKMFMEKVWGFQVINFGLLQLNSNIQLITYNPFENTTKISDNSQDCNIDIFNNCFGHFFGIDIKIAFFENVQFALEKQMKVAWADGHFWINILQRLNASRTLVQTEAFDYNDATKIVVDGQADMCMHRYFVMEDRHSVDFFTSNEIEYLVALVPKAEKMPHSFYAIATLTPTLWLCIFISLAMFISTMILVEKILSADSKNTVLHLLGVLFLQPVRRISSYLTPQIFLINFWQLSCLIIIAAFQGALLKSLLMPKYFEEINTISKLRNSRLPIYTIKDFRKQIQEAAPILKEQLVNISEKHLTEQLLGYIKVNGAFIVTSFVADMVVEKYRRNGVKNKYHKMEEKITPGLNAYIFKKNLPYVKIFENMFLRLYQHGLIQKAKFNKQEKKNQKLKPLSMKHLQGIFYLMLVGEAAAVLVFIFEKFNRHSAYVPKYFFHFKRV